MDFIKQNLIFVRECLQEFDTTGSFCPTSKWAARALIAPLSGVRSRKRILEAGPGTGSVTTQILKNMHDDDELVICELNPRFMTALKNHLLDNEYFLRHRKRITFFQGPVQDLPESGTFDLIVCAIPFLNLPVLIVREIFEKFREISNENTSLTYYEYIGMRNLGKVSPGRRRRLKELEGFFSTMHDEGLTSRRRIWLNVLPINVYRLDKMAA